MTEFDLRVSGFLFYKQHKRALEKIHKVFSVSGFTVNVAPCSLWANTGSGLSFCSETTCLQALDPAQYYE